MRVGFEEPVHEPESVWGDDSIQLSQIILFACWCKPMKTADIQGKIEQTCDVVEFGNVANVKVGVQVRMVELLLGDSDGT